MIPLVAITGRPNVGKSTLFNRLLRSRQAIVQDEPGVTRDRHYGTCSYEGRTFSLVDTGGFIPEATKGLEALVREQTQLAIDEADLVLTVLDARQGLMDADKAIVDTLRRSGKPVLYVANKVEGAEQRALAMEFYRLGAAGILCISAEHGLGMEELVDAILTRLPPVEESKPANTDDNPQQDSIRVALVGRPNAGKSSLLNCLAGKQRAIVSEMPGTTRDSIDVLLDTAHGPFTLVDTAGIRRHRRASPEMEKYAILRALRSINNADVVCLIIDAKEGVAEQDAKIAGMALEAGKGLALAFSKMDLLVPRVPAKRKLEAQTREKLQFIPYAPLLFLSTITGQGIKRLLPAIKRIHNECGKRISTSELNRFLEEVAAAHTPPAHRGRPVRFYYITQPQAFPPTFLVSTNYSNGIHITYRRYLVNKLRQRFGFKGSPLRLFFRQRARPPK